MVSKGFDIINKPIIFMQGMIHMSYTTRYRTTYKIKSRHARLSPEVFYISPEY